MSYRKHATASVGIEDRAAKMRRLLDERVNRGREGLDLNEDKKGHSSFIVHRHHDMNDSVFDLGAKFCNEDPLFNYRAWVHWMTDAEILLHSGGVTIHHRSQFFCQGAAEHFQERLDKHFGVAVRFRPSVSISNRVEM